MFNHIMVGSNDMQKSKSFYDKVLGVLGFGIAWAVFGQDIGMVIGATLFCVCTISAMVGGMMPIVAKTVGADPAVFGQVASDPTVSRLISTLADDAPAALSAMVPFPKRLGKAQAGTAPGGVDLVAVTQAHWYDLWA